MPSDKVRRPPSRPQVVPWNAGTPGGAERMVDQLVESSARQEQMLGRVRRTLDLAIGENRIAHGLGRKVFLCVLTPTVADATFAWSMRADGERYAIITIAGVAQPACNLEFS